MTRTDRTTAFDLRLVDSVPEKTQSYIDLCQNKPVLVPYILKACAFDFDSAGVATIFNKTNRVASATRMQPTPEYHARYR